MKTLSFSFLVLVSSVFVLVASEYDTLKAFGIPYNQFYCGPNANRGLVDKIIEAIDSVCPAVASEVNHCCAAHDDCYSNKRGQKQCDEQFCSCLNYIENHAEAAGKCEDIQLITVNGCVLVKGFGKDSYNLKGSMEAFKYKNVPAIPKISKDYSALYEKCATQQVTLGSCALNYDICTGKNTTNCAVVLIKCLDETQYGRDPDATCDTAIEKLQNKLLFSEEANLTTPQIIILDIERKVTKTKVFIVQVYRKASRPGSSIYFYLVGLGSIFIVGVLVILACVLIDRTDEEQTDDFYPNTQSTWSQKSTMSTSAARSR